MDQPATKREIALLLERIDKTENTLLKELARHTQTIGDDMRRSIGLVDDRYNDLPARVSRLEEVVFKPTPIKRRRSR